MSWPTFAEAATLRFLVPMPSLWDRYLLAGLLFAGGLVLWTLVPGIGLVGLVLVLLGHLPLWVRTQTISPGGATPVHEDVWAPAEDGWASRLAEIERRGKEWDTTPWDITCQRGCLTFLGAAAILGVALIVLGAVLGFDAYAHLALAAVVLVVPVWLNGVRTTWNPSELGLKGDALVTAWSAVAEDVQGEYDKVPLLALREGRRGKYPVDARLMLRPTTDDGSGLIGIQIQVAINNVRGTDYPYLYCVILGKPDFVLPRFADGKKTKIRDKAMVYELGRGSDVTYEVVRQHADNRGGWHTAANHIRRIMLAALGDAREARDHNRGRSS